MNAMIKLALAQNLRGLFGLKQPEPSHDFRGAGMSLGGLGGAAAGIGAHETFLNQLMRATQNGSYGFSGEPAPFPGRGDRILDIIRRKGITNVKGMADTFGPAALRNSKFPAHVFPWAKRTLAVGRMLGTNPRMALLGALLGGLTFGELGGGIDRLRR